MVGRETRACIVCGEAFTVRPKSGQKCCGQVCASRASAAASKARFPELTCERCGCSFRRKSGGSRNAGRFCSRPCAFAAKAAESVQRKESAKRAREEAAAARRTLVLERREARLAARKVAVTQASCWCCGATFQKVYTGGGRSKFCSETCRERQRRRRPSILARKRHPSYRRSKRVEKAARRARIRATATQPIDPIAIFIRDGWRCQLCGIKTPKRLRGRMVDTAPEMDHIVPLALGGTHTRENVQCSCRRCNLAKGATIAGQLRLCG